MKVLGDSGQAMAEYAIVNALVVVMAFSAWLVPETSLGFVQTFLKNVLANVALPMP